jgi:hypothetical protein
LAGILGMKMRWRMVRAIHPNDDAIEVTDAWHLVLLSDSE